MKELDIKKELRRKANVSSLRQLGAEFRALKVQMEQPKKCCSVKALELRRYQFTGRVYHPNFGQALPDGVGYHDYVSIRLQDELVQGKVLAPSEEEVMALLTLEAHEQYPDHIKVELADVSTLPADW